MSGTQPARERIPGVRERSPGCERDEHETAQEAKREVAGGARAADLVGI